MDRRLAVEFRETPGMTLEELTRVARKQDQDLPPFWISLAPIALPVLLISSNTAANAIDKTHAAAKVTAFLGNPNFALLLSAAIAMHTLARQKGYSLAKLAEALEPALASGGLIILITAAGGAYGGMLVKAGVGETLAKAAESWGVPILVLAFLLAMLLKIAQGSSTVAMITVSSILVPIVTATPPPFHLVYLAMVIASGSLVGSWMNDSGFWVYKQMSGLTETEALKTWTPLLMILGLTGGAISMLLSWLVPLR